MYSYEQISNNKERMDAPLFTPKQSFSFLILQKPNQTTKIKKRILKTQSKPMNTHYQVIKLKS